MAARLSAAVRGEPRPRVLAPRLPAPAQAGHAYHAFLVPTFESGRLAGLGRDPSAAPHATASAWARTTAARTGPAAGLPPLDFRTGAVGDFEYLVRLLEPRPVDPRVGVRDMDVQRPAPNLPGIDDPALGGVLRLGGALRVPRDSLDPDERADVLAQENWAQPYPHPFQPRSPRSINLADDYAHTTAAAGERRDGSTSAAIRTR